MERVEFNSQICNQIVAKFLSSIISVKGWKWNRCLDLKLNYNTSLSLKNMQRIRCLVTWKARNCRINRDQFNSPDPRVDCSKVSSSLDVPTKFQYSPHSSCARVWYLNLWLDFSKLHAFRTGNSEVVYRLRNYLYSWEISDRVIKKVYWIYNQTVAKLNRFTTTSCCCGECSLTVKTTARLLQSSFL